MIRLSHLHIAEAVPLGYALVARVASDAGVRALCIKGPFTAALGSRPGAFVSSDVDVFVDPSAELEFATSLIAAGWEPRPPSTAASVDVPYSRQYINRDFGIEIDVHHRFPGMLATPQVCFEALWGSSVDLQVANVDCRGTDSHASMLIELLHLARDPLRRRQRVRAATSSPLCESEQFVRLVRLTGSRPALADLGVITSADDGGIYNPEDWNRWTARQHLARVGSAPALYQLLRSKPHLWPQLLLRLLFLQQEQLDRKYPDLVGRRCSRARGLIRRIFDGVRALPAAIVAVRRYYSRASKPL